jgi:hypothetical protein
MKKEDIKEGVVVRNKRNGKIGAPHTGCDYGCIDGEVEVGIVYQGSDTSPSQPTFEGTCFDDLEEHELRPEDLLTKKHIKRVCKPKTKDACRYLVAGEYGLDCARVFGDIDIAIEIDRKVREGSSAATKINCGGRYKSQSLR